MTTNFSVTAIIIFSSLTLQASSEFHNMELGNCSNHENIINNLEGEQKEQDLIPQESFTIPESLLCQVCHQPIVYFCILKSLLTLGRALSSSAFS